MFEKYKCWTDYYKYNRINSWCKLMGLCLSKLRMEIDNLQHKSCWWRDYIQVHMINSLRHYRIDNLMYKQRMIQYFDLNKIQIHILSKLLEHFLSILYSYRGRVSIGLVGLLKIQKHTLHKHLD